MSDPDRQSFLRSFGFTRRDIKRIKAHAESLTNSDTPAALDDLDVPFRVGAALPDQAKWMGGERLGEWKGRVLLYWPIREGREREAWERRKRRGPSSEIV